MRLLQDSVKQKIIYVFLALVLVFHSANAAETRSFHWLDDDDYPPLIYRGTDGKPAGIFYQIMTTAFHRLNIPLKAEICPWARAQKIIADGKADGMVTVLTNARKRFLVGSDPVLQVSEHIFVNRDNPRLKEIMAIRSIRQLRDFKLVETIGSGWTKEVLNDCDITWVPSMDNAFTMLNNRRADIFITNGFVGADFLQKKIRNGDSLSEGYKSIITNPYPLRTISFRLLVRKDSPFTTIIDKFNRTIQQMQADGTIRHILEGTQLPLPDSAYPSP